MTTITIDLHEEPSEQVGDLYIRSLAPLPGLRLSGTLRGSSVAVLADTLEPCLVSGGDVHLDVEHLRAAETAGLFSLVATASRIAADRQLILHRPSPNLIKLITAEWGAVPGLIVSTL